MGEGPSLLELPLFMNPDDVSLEADPSADLSSPAEEKTRYQAAWKTLDEHAKRFWIGIVLFLPVVLLITAILGRFIFSFFAFGIALAVYVGIRALLRLDRGPSYYNFRCPRCGSEFFRTGKKVDTLSPKCGSCSLPRGALPPDFHPPVKAPHAK